MDYCQQASARTNWVRRNEALAYCRLVRSEACRVLLIQARAGQGKTTLAEQYAQEFEGDVCWCACSGAETDHMELLNKLCSALSAGTDGFTPADILAAARASMSPEEARAAVANGLPAAFTGKNRPVLVVVDDVHLIAAASESLAMLRAFVDACPESVTFAILTRTALQLDNKPLFTFFKTVRIDEETLALSGAEIGQLHEIVHGRRLSSSECASILLATEGWTTGALLMGLGSDTRQLQDNSESLSLYFWDTCLAGASRQAVADIIRMALLNDFPVGMVRALGLNEGALLAEELAARNLFVRVGQGADGPVYRLHHLFRDSLRHMARSEMSEEQRDRFLVDAANWHMEKGDVAEGLRCLVTARKWDALVLGLQTHGMMFINMNRLTTLESIISDCPEAVVHSSGWLMLLLGRVRITFDPERSLDLICAAHRRFVAKGDKKGELIALIFQAFAHLMVTGKLRKFIKTMPRARELFSQFREELSPPTQVVCTFVLALAHCYGLGDNKRSHRYAAMARETLSSMGVGKTTPDIELISLYTSGLSGELKTALERFEQIFGRLHAPEVCPSTRLSVSTAYANFRLMHGDIEGYERSKSEVEKDFPELLKLSYLGAFYCIWDADVQLAQGDIAKAEATAQALLDHPVYSRIGHIESQAHQYLALCNGFSGKPEQALRHARSAARIRAQIGGWFFIRLNHAVTGAALALCGDHGRAERAFGRSLTECAAIGDCYIAPQAWAYRAWSRLEQGRTEDAHRDIRRMLEQLSRQGNSHFFYREKNVMRRLTDEALENGIMPNSAQRLSDIWFGSQQKEDGKSCLAEAQKGLACLNSRAPWSAHLHFTAASECIGRMGEYDEPGKALLRRAFIAWVGLLRDSHRQNRGLVVAEKALSLFPECPELLAHSRSLRTAGQR